MKSGTAKKGDRRYPIIHRKGLAHNGSGFSSINRGIQLYPSAVYSE
jgi:hypothetical protein